LIFGVAKSLFNLEKKGGMPRKGEKFPIFADRGLSLMKSAGMIWRCDGVLPPRKGQVFRRDVIILFEDCPPIHTGKYGLGERLVRWQRL
jgi:hypothetical protein